MTEGIAIPLIDCEAGAEAAGAGICAVIAIPLVDGWAGPEAAGTAGREGIVIPRIDRDA